MGQKEIIEYLEKQNGRFCTAQEIISNVKSGRRSVYRCIGWLVRRAEIDSVYVESDQSGPGITGVKNVWKYAVTK